MKIGILLRRVCFARNIILMKEVRVLSPGTHDVTAAREIPA